MKGWIVGVAMIALAGCTRPNAEAGCTKDGDCKGDRLCVNGMCGPPPATGAPRAEAAAGAEQAAVASATVGNAAGPSCDAVVAHIAEIAKRAIPSSPYDAADNVKKCRSQAPSAAHLACLMKGTTVADVGACDKEVFKGVEVSTAVKREFDGLKLDKTQKPGSLDGDYLVFRKTNERKCGFLSREQQFAQAMFVMCGGAIISGPLTTTKDIEDVSRELANQQRQEHDLVMSIMNNYPYGRPTKVYDAKTGAYLGTRN